METYQSYYSRIEKPFFAPAPEVFGIAWGIIYPLIAIAFVVVLFKTLQKKLERKIIFVFLLNLAVNFAFTPLQLGLSETPLATIDILLVLGTLLWLLALLCKSKQWLPFALLIPYALWASFATVLQITIFFLNLG